MKYEELVAKGLARLEAEGLHERIARFLGKQGGCESGQTSVANRQYFNQITLKMRLLDSQWADTNITLFDHQLKTPIMSGAMSGMENLHEDPLKHIARGLAEAGSMMWVGICSNEQLQSVLEEEAPVVKISKPWIDNEVIIEKLGYAEDHGAVAVGVDIDHCFGAKVGDVLRLENRVEPKTVNDLTDIMSTVTVPFVVKGVLSVEDAVKAQDTGAQAIVISNHGAAALDYAAHPLQILPEVREVLERGVEILVDSGFRRGTDVLKGLAFGARGVLMGSTTYIGLAANGAEGVRDMFLAITEELRRTMSMTGCPSVSHVTREILRVASGVWPRER